MIFNKLLSLIRDGIRDPHKIPPYLIRQWFPSKYKKWYQTTTGITFQIGGFAGGTDSIPEFSARNYYEISLMRDVLQTHEITVQNSLEIGCGYGRLSPWIAEFAENHYGIDINEEAIDKARVLYPHLHWKNSSIQHNRLQSNKFQLTVTWTVLQHIPPSEINNVRSQINRISSKGGYLLICEETEGPGDNHVWPRSIKTYDWLFRQFKLIETRSRQLEPTYNDHSPGGEIMLFKHVS